MDCVELRVSHESLRRRSCSGWKFNLFLPLLLVLPSNIWCTQLLITCTAMTIWCTMKKNLLCTSQQGSWGGEERWIWWWCDLMTMPHSFIPSNSTRLNSALDVRNRLGKGCILRCMFGLCNDTRASSTLASREILWSEHQRSHLQVQQLKDTCMTTRGGGNPPSCWCLVRNEDAQREAQSQ